MPKRDDNDGVVEARLRSLLAVPGRSDTFEDRSPVSWSELIPSWPDDVDLQPLASPPDAAVHRPWGPADMPLRRPDPAPPPTGEPLSASGAFAGRFAAFDPGRRGVKALAAVAVVVVLVAGFLAWRARPATETIAPAEPVVPSWSASATAPAGPSSAAELVVAVGGKVTKPGLVRLPTGARVADAIKAAGGAQRGVDPAPLNLARKVVDGELIMVGVAPPPGGAPASAGGAGGPLNLNVATLADLDGLPGVGPVLAQRIIEARDAQGGFKAVGDLRKVSGIGASRFEQLKDLVTV